MARKAASSTRFATSRMTTEASVWVIVLLYKRVLIARLGNALEFSRQYLRTMRPLLGNRAELSDESVSKWYRYVTFHTDRSDE
jgi:hypothetical protein